jgi:hypothetical protein
MYSVQFASVLSLTVPDDSVLYHIYLTQINTVISVTFGMYAVDGNIYKILGRKPEGRRSRHR